MVRSFNDQEEDRMPGRPITRPTAQVLHDPTAQKTHTQKTAAAMAGFQPQHRASRWEEEPATALRAANARGATVAASLIPLQTSGITRLFRF